MGSEGMDTLYFRDKTNYPLKANSDTPRNENAFVTGSLYRISYRPEYKTVTFTFAVVNSRIKLNIGKLKIKYAI
jgi:hypothetical protein